MNDKIVEIVGTIIAISCAVIALVFYTINALSKEKRIERLECEVKLLKLERRNYEK